MAEPLRVGTCSWKYPSWKGLVYSAESGVDFLSEYSARYNTVEVDQWFWTLPEYEVAAQYAHVTPPGFRFSVKLPNALTLTHLRGKKIQGLKPNPEFLSVDVYRDVLARLSGLTEKLGILMLQFEYMPREKMPSQAEFLSSLARFLAEVPREIPLGIETRNPRWLDERYFRFLAEHDVAHVFLQGYFMPSVLEVYHDFGRLLRGSVVVRLHGPDRAGIEEATGERWDTIVEPKDQELPGIAEMVNQMLGRSLTVYLNVNNHYEGSAPLTIERLRRHGLAERAEEPDE